MQSEIFILKRNKNENVLSCSVVKSVMAELRMADENLTRSSLGRLAFIGELYDIRNESLKSMSLFSDSKLLSKMIKTIDVPHTDFKYSLTETISDRFDLLKVEPELQLNILFGLIKIEGSGKFLSEDKKSEKTVNCSVICQVKTVHEKFFGSPDEILTFTDMNILKDPQNTHMISEITWGANCLLNLEYSVADNDNKEEIQGRLAAGLADLKFLKVEGGGHLEKRKSDLFTRKGMKIKINADVVPEGEWPTTVEGFCEFVANVPKLLEKVNGGKGKPLSYVLMPLDGFRKLAQLECEIDAFILKRVDEGFLMSTIFLFEEIARVKQKLQDFYAELTNYKKYVKDDDLKEAGRTIERLLIQESNLKNIMSEDWVLVRKGEKPLKDMIRCLEKFKYSDLKLLSYTEYLESCSPIMKKLSTVANYTSRGIVYLGKGESFQDLQDPNVNLEYIVLVTSSKLENEDLDLSKNTSLYFLSLAIEPKPGTKYVVVDLEFSGKQTFFNIEIKEVRCFHIKGHKLLSSDLFAAYIAETEMNFVRLKQKGEMNLSQGKPGNRTTLEMVCPGYCTENCPPTPVEWTCYNCKSMIEYDFNDYYYCSCGKFLATSCEYRCSNLKHGSAFVSAEDKFLKDALRKLHPLPEVNILFLGQSGVGKSTFINSIVNYLTYESIEAAKEHGVICTIPISIPIYDPKTMKKHVVQFGTKSDNEVTAIGHSSTQFPHTYTFIWNKKCVRIIDSPGLGDTKGIAKDKENLRNIIDHLGYFKELHGVCILLKANDNKFNVLFKYCIKELLANLHRSVIKNIVFCFTNSRNSLYSPGQASSVLEKVLSDTGIDNELQLGPHNVFSFDNEAFLFLCSTQVSEIQRTEVVKASFGESWRISLEETKRLFETIDSFEPHLLKETITLVTARSRVLTLTKPLAEICKVIQQNIAVLEKQQEEINKSDLTLSDLKGKLIMTVMRLEPEPLPQPRTVCTSSCCVEYFNYKGTDVREIEYKTHCHPQCYLRQVTPKTVNNVQLKGCQAMSNGKCTVCGCGWEMHMHITYSQKRVPTTVVDKKVEEELNKEKSERDKKKEFISKLESIIDKYKEEEKVIIQASVKFGMFLKQNAITVYNDSVLELLEYLIDEEESKPHKTNTEKQILKNLQETLNQYKAEVVVIEEVLRKGDEEEKISIEDMQKLENSLYRLELTGEDIRKNVEASRTGNEKMMIYSETSIHFNTLDNSMPHRKGKINDYIKNKIKKGKEMLNKILY